MRQLGELETPQKESKPTTLSSTIFTSPKLALLLVMGTNKILSAKDFKQRTTGIEPVYTRATTQRFYQYQPHSLKNEYLIGLRLTDDYPRIYLPTEKIGAGQRELPSSIPTLGTSSTSSGWTGYQHFHGLFAFVNILAQNVKLLPSATRPCANVLYRSFLPSRQTSLLAFLRFAALPSYHLTQIQEMVLTSPAITLATLSGVLFLIISALYLRNWLRAYVRKSHLV